MTTPPNGSSGWSYWSDEASNEIPPEYLTASTSPLPPLSTLALFPFPPQQPPPSSMPTKPVDPFIFLDNFPWNTQQHAPSTSQHAQTTNPPQPEQPQPSSSAHLLNEQRLSTCLNILRHIQRTLHQRRAETSAHLTHTSALVAQAAWDLFHGSPLDFMCHEMDMLTADDDDAAATTNAILLDKSPVGIGSSGGNLSLTSRQEESDAWMKKLDGLRDLRDDEEELRRRVEKIARQMDLARGMMRVGMAEQRDVLARSDALARWYQSGFQRGFVQVPATTAMPAPTASSPRNVDDKVKADNEAAGPAPKSSFFDWPVPATISKGKQAAVESEDEEGSGASSGFESPRECQGECCQHLTS